MQALRCPRVRSESSSRKLKLVHFFSDRTPIGDGLVGSFGSSFELQSYGVLNDKAFADIGDSAGWDSVVRGLRASPPELVVMTPPSFTFRANVAKGASVRTKLGSQVHGRKRLKTKT